MDKSGGMLEISIIKVVDPGCLWGKVVKGPGMQAENPREYEDLQTKMNLFYHDVNLEVQEIKPTTLEEGQLCAVFCPVLKSWCRATVESLFVGTVGSQAMCFLVDHGERFIINTDDVRALLEKFLQLPFRVRRFQLARIYPMRLKVSISTETAELVPSPCWDVSATKYLHNLLKVSTLVEAVLCETNADCTAVELYLTIRNVKICVNDDLVVKKFACYSSEKAITEEQNESLDRSLVSLAWDMFSRPQQILEMNGCCTVRSHFPRVVPKKETEQLGLTLLANPPMSVVKSPHPTVEVSAMETKTETSGVSEEDESTWSLEKDDCVTGNSEQTENTEGALAEQLSLKLNLIRVMKFLNPFSHLNLIEEPNEADEQKQTSHGESAAEKSDLTLSQYLEEDSAICLEMEKTTKSSAQNDSDLSHSTSNDTSTELKETDFSQESNAKDQLSCARLLQLLNPDPLNLDTECIEDNIVCYEPSRRGVLVHSAVTVNPCSNLSLAPITEQFRKFLLRRKYNGPGLAESYAWPSVARGCDTVLVVHGGNDPLTYIPPLLAQLQMASVFSALNTRKGPIAVILCPGWEKVQYVLDLLEDSQAAASLHPAAVLLGLKKDEAKNAKIQKNCQLLVTTPFSLARLLEVHCFLFLRLCHLVLDEVSELYSRAPDQMSAILKHFREVAREKSLECSQQIVAVSNQWSRELDGLITEHMVSPCVVVTVPEEAAVYGGVLQTVLLCLDCNKTSVMLSSLDFSPSVPQKTLIVTNSVEEVEHVYKAVSNTAAFSLKAHEGLSYQFDFVVEQWKKDIGSGTQVILVTTNDSMKALGIRDATCVVHYGFPGSPKLFGNRLFCMSDNFQNQAKKSSSPVVRSVMLLSERNARHVSGVLRYLKRTCATLPPELLQFSEGVQQAKEEQKIGRALCSHLKSLGFCRESAVCPDRHIINRTLDHPLHPDSGTIQVLPLYIKSANVYYGRIVSQKQDQFKDLAAEMNSHYTEERVFAKDVVKGGLYAVHEEEEYHRVCVTKVPDKEDKLFSSVTAHFIDDGYVQEVKSHQLLQLPSEFQSLPGQAVEIILCRVQPIDGEMDWNPKVTRAISLKIKGKLHQAKLIKCLGSTVWVDPMIRVTRVPGLSSFINEYNVHDEIIATGMGTINSQHLELLKTLCFGEEASAAVVPSESERCESEELRVQAAEEALASRMKAAFPSLCSVDKLTANYHSADICEPSEVMKNIRPTQITVPNGGLSIATMVDDGQIDRSVQPRLLPLVWTAAVSNKTTGETEMAEILHTEKSVDIVPQSFHPQIKWFQREESVTLKVKLVNPMMQKCEFFSDRVLYSSYVRSRRYCADLELHSDIRTEQCKWEMKCNEPEITLVKKEKGLWKSLLKCKACNTFVSYDFDHIEDEDKPATNDCSFLASTGEVGIYTNSGSGSDSD
ncbi:putative ATP-dependent RNA helicase TDRD12 isoform X1 [Astyanax mexicanus]|uniref:RNA helicase n=1 Tax=Astyanax mexicanus TaxID=7994 RepID=A0A8T2M9Z5_ASTMX|nr:putative ATP-dependent RNA helicase TDRD12 isoform X1 [Astyanax mexicanus]